VKESTRNIFKMHGWRVDRAAHNWLYFVFYGLYVRVFLWLGHLVYSLLGRVSLGSRMFGMVFDRYHAKIVTMDDAAKILTLNEDVIIGPDRTERIIPFPHANNIILKEPDYIAVMDCPCRLAREDGCRPVNVCMAVGRTTAQFWLEHGRKYHARKISQEEALSILREAHDRGNITTSWFKVATGGRTGVICACCTCCCGGLEGMRLVKKFKGGEELSNMISSGYVAIVDALACEACGLCAGTCFFEAAVIDGQGVLVQDTAACMGCGLCVERCPAGARKLEADPSKGLPLDIDLVMNELG
jgi:NAD-dependent dihydropyrimidine dehydrogenase PreA subunit